MDLIDTAWIPSNYQSGRTVQVPANYGTEGSLSINDWTPTFVPPNGANASDPRIPQWNRLIAIDWEQIVLAPDEAARFQNQLQQRATMLPSLYSPPGTASLITGQE